MEKPKRILLFDNIKALLILFVVVGHFIEPYLGQSHAMKALWIFIYSFHMPLFLFIAGLMHKGYKIEDKLNQYRVVHFLICGYALRIILGLIKAVCAESGSVTFKLFDSGGDVTWFVMALALYELITFFVRGIRPSVGIIAGVLLSIFVGYDSSIGDFLELSRVVVFSPFYLLGYYLQPQAVSKWANKRWIKPLSLVILLGYMAVCYVEADLIYRYRGLFTGRNSFEFVAKTLPNVNFSSRIFTTLISMTVGAAIISLIPNKRIGLVSQLGSKTLQIYFWHYPVFYVLSRLQLYEKLCACFGAEMGKILFVLSAIGCAALCLLPPFSHPTDEIQKLGYLAGMR